MYQSILTDHGSIVRECSEEGRGSDEEGDDSGRPRHALVVVVVDPQEHMPQFTKNVYFTCAALHFNVSLNKRELILD